MDSSTALRTSAMVGLSSAFWLSGVAFSSSHLALPTLYPLPAAASTGVFKDFYQRGISVLVPGALLSAASYAVAAYLDPVKRNNYLIAAALTVVAQPFTIIFMLDTNNKLVQMADDEKVREKAGQDGAVALLKKWQSLNMVRAGLYLAGGVAGLLVYTGEI